MFDYYWPQFSKIVVRVLHSPAPRFLEVPRNHERRTVYSRLAVDENAVASWRSQREEFFARVLKLGRDVLVSRCYRHPHVFYAVAGFPKVFYARQFFLLLERHQVQDDANPHFFDVVCEHGVTYL